MREESSTLPNRYVMIKLKTNLQKSKNYDETVDYFEDDSVKESEEKSNFEQEHRSDDN